MTRSAVYTAIELESHGENYTSHRQRTPQSTFSSEESILQASRIGDSTVPDGGYRWAVIFGYNVITLNLIGTIYCWGVVSAALMKQHLSSSLNVSCIRSSSNLYGAFSGIGNAKTNRMLGARNTALLGVSLFA